MCPWGHTWEWLVVLICAIRQEVIRYRIILLSLKVCKLYLSKAPDSLVLLLN